MVNHYFIFAPQDNIVRQLVAAGVHCVRPDYIAAYIMDDPAPPPSQYYIPEVLAVGARAEGSVGNRGEGCGGTWEGSRGAVGAEEQRKRKHASPADMAATDKPQSKRSKS